jgi:hypothetical protein
MNEIDEAWRAAEQLTPEDALLRLESLGEGLCRAGFVRNGEWLLYASRHTPTEALRELAARWPEVSEQK